MDTAEIIGPEQEKDYKETNITDLELSEAIEEQCFGGLGSGSKKRTVGSSGSESGDTNKIIKEVKKIKTSNNFIPDIAAPSK